MIKSDNIFYDSIAFLFVSKIFTFNVIKIK